MLGGLLQESRVLLFFAVFCCFLLVFAGFCGFLLVFACCVFHVHLANNIDWYIIDIHMIMITIMIVHICIYSYDYEIAQYNSKYIGDTFFFIINFSFQI